MRMLCIDGSDIKRLTVGTYEWVDLVVAGNNGWTAKASETRNVGPEGYLAAIMDRINLDETDGIVAVTGPGSATALRTSLSIVNAIAVARKIPLYGVEKFNDEPFSSVFCNSEFPGNTKPDEFLIPKYANDARITESNKDALRRRQS